MIEDHDQDKIDAQEQEDTLLNDFMMFVGLCMAMIGVFIVAALGSGCAGPRGDRGLNGHPGLDAKPCTVRGLPNGEGVIITCPDGTSQTIHDGQDGVNGAVGSQGPKGDTGSPGQDAQGSYAVQLCAGPVEYPNSFPEKALCIGNKLFGVYWDTHNAWLAELPPGAYASTSTTTPCSFTILEGCQIQ